jgi:hypothetical protein
VETVDLKLTAEQKKKLQDFVAIDTTEVFKYVPLVYRQKKPDGEYLFPKEMWPVFTLKGKDAFDLAKTEDSIGVMDVDQKTMMPKQMRMTSGTVRIETLKKGVKGWKNFKNEKGQIVHYKGSESIAVLKSKLQTELQNAINEHTVLTEEELRGLE